MSRFFYHILLSFLRALVYVKRALLWVFRRLLLVGSRLSAIHRKTVGFYFYKFFFLLKKKFGGATIFGRSWVIHQLFTRGFLQLFLLCVGLLLMIPESRVFTRDETHIPGRKTILYALVGPGDQDFALEEVTAAGPERSEPGEDRSWRSGAAAVLPGATVGEPLDTTQRGIAGMSMGGMAALKPTIIPGAVLPGTFSPQSRTAIVLYEVQPGDVISAIAERYSVSVASILWANNLSVRSYIRPGDTLKIPPISGVIHTVKKGDTVLKIARAYKANEADIIAFNKLQPDGSDLTIGEDLIIPGGERPTPVVTPSRSTALANIAAPPASVDAPAGSGYIWPAAVRRVTQYFGLRHTGVDIAGPSGTAVYAARAGVVNISRCGWNGGYGCYIIIDHGGGVQTLYGHHSQLFVSPGQEVAQGQTIAAMGSTGRSTGPHVHFEVRVNGRKQNPLRYIR